MYQKFSIPPKNFKILAHTKSCPIAAIGNSEKKIYGLQFHPEVQHTNRGLELIKNFIFNICKTEPNWTAESFIKNEVNRIKDKVEKKTCIMWLIRWGRFNRSRHIDT